MKKVLLNNSIFILIIVVMGILFLKRYSYLQIPIVSSPDSGILFHTDDGVMEQTWQPEVKVLAGINIPFLAENSFTGDLQVKVLSDDGSAILAMAVQTMDFQGGERGNVYFPFGKIKIGQGERYRIQFSILNPSEPGALEIPSGSNYGGCSVSGKEIGQAAAFTMIAAKSSRLFWLMAVLFPLFAYSLLMMVATGRKWEETVATALFLEGIILYLFGLAEQLLWGIHFVYLLALGAVIVSIYWYNKKGWSLKRLHSAGVWVFLVLFGVILVSCKGDWLGMRDDLRHWGIAARDMFYFDSFAKHMDTTVILPRYLPFTTLIEYFFEYANGSFSEDILLIAFQVMLLCATMIFCVLLQKREKKKWLLPVVSAMICIPVLFFSNLSSTIMVDSLMAVIMAYILICYYSEGMSWFNRIRICCAMCALALTKETGLVLAGVSALILFGDIFFRGMQKKKLDIKGLLYPVICVALVLGTYFSWQIYLNIPVKNNIEKAVYEETSQGAAQKEEKSTEGLAKEGSEAKENQVAPVQTKSAITASGISLEGLKAVLTGNGEWYQYQTTRNFLVELLDGETYSVGPMKLSFVDFLVGIVFLMVSLAFFGYWDGERGQKYIFAGMALIAGACFCAFLQVTYWFAFDRYEAMDLTSYDRYLAPYLCAIVMTIIYLIFEGNQQSKWERKKADFLVYLLTVFWIVTMPVEGLIFESSSLEENTTQENTYGYDKIAEILRSMADKGEKVHFICSNSDGYAAYIFRNAVCPIVSEYDFWNIVPDQETYDKQYEIYKEGEINIHNTAYLMSKEAWESEIRKCKYVVIFHADELFKQSYPELFRETTIQDGSVYQVMDASGDMFLRFVGRTEIRGYH